MNESWGYYADYFDNLGEVVLQTCNQMDEFVLFNRIADLTMANSNCGSKCTKVALPILLHLQLSFVFIHLTICGILLLLPFKHC